MAFRLDKYDSDKFTEGAWEKIQIGQDSGWFKLAYFGNPTHKAAERRIFKELRRRYGDEDSIPEEEVHEANAQAFAEGLLRDWEEITAEDEHGNEVDVPFTLDNAVQLLLGRPDAHAHMLGKSKRMGRFEREEAETQAKKPATTSSSAKTGKATTSSSGE